AVRPRAWSSCFTVPRIRALRAPASARAFAQGEGAHGSQTEPQAPGFQGANELLLALGGDHQRLALAVVDAQAVERQGGAGERVAGGADGADVAKWHAPFEGAALHQQVLVV